MSMLCNPTYKVGDVVWVNGRKCRVIKALAKKYIVANGLIGFIIERSEAKPIIRMYGVLA